MIMLLAFVLLLLRFLLWRFAFVTRCFGWMPAWLRTFAHPLGLMCAL